MTPQEIFDKSVSLVIKQGEGAYNNNKGSCHYRLNYDDKILKCAIGHLIDDYIYNEEIEGVSIGQLIDEEMITIPEYFKENNLLLSNLQKAHDSAAHTMESVVTRKSLLMFFLFRQGKLLKILICRILLSKRH
jgi:hypothetical protein